MNNNNWYITIDANILLNKDISSTEKLLFGMISNLESMHGECNATNKYFAEYLNVSATQVSIIIKNLLQLNLIKRQIIMNEKKQIVKRILNTTQHLSKKTQTPYPRKRKSPMQEKTKENNIININKIKIA